MTPANGPAVSPRELEKALNESGETPAHVDLNRLKVRIEVICDFENLRKLRELIKPLAPTVD